MSHTRFHGFALRHGNTFILLVESIHNLIGFAYWIRNLSWHSSRHLCESISCRKPTQI